MSHKLVEGVRHVDVDELKQLLNEDKSSYFIDVREPEEYVEGHIPGVPLLSMGDILDVVDDFDRHARYYLICRSGRRSLEVSKFFKAEGIEDVFNYEGGMLEWDGDIVKGEENIVGEFSMKNLERVE